MLAFAVPAVYAALPLVVEIVAAGVLAVPWQLQQRPINRSKHAPPLRLEFAA